MYLLESKNRARFTWEKVEDLKMEHCYVAQDYASEARLFQVRNVCLSSKLIYCYERLTSLMI